MKVRNIINLSSKVSTQNPPRPPLSKSARLETEGRMGGFIKNVGEWEG